MDNTDRIERRLKLHDVRVLMSVVQAGSMSKAAERLGAKIGIPKKDQPA